MVCLIRRVVDYRDLQGCWMLLALPGSKVCALWSNHPCSLKLFFPKDEWMHDACDDKKYKNGKPEVLPELQVVLNDSDERALSIARHNTDHVLTTTNTTTRHHHPDRITLTQRVAQSLLHEQTFEIFILDPFGAVPPFLDATLNRSISATNVGVTYGTRPSVAALHYGVQLRKKRPPCYRERGARILLAAVAQATGRWDWGIEVVYGLSTEYYCLVSVRVVRGKNAADETAGLMQLVRICRTCGAVGAGTTTEGCSNVEGTCAPNPPRCGCEPADVNRSMGLVPMHEKKVHCGLDRCTMWMLCDRWRIYPDSRKRKV